MKKVIILALIAFAICLIGYFSLFGFSTGDSEDATNYKNESESQDLDRTEVVQEAQSGFATLEELSAWNKNLECSIVYADEDQSTEVEGTYFVSEGKIRGDFLTESPDLSGQVLSSMIIVDEEMYIWSEIDGQRYGMKMNLSDTEDSSIDTNEPVPMGQNVKYDCKQWDNVDETVFVPPGDVLFNDIQNMLKAGFEEGIIYEEGQLPNF